MYFEHKHPPRSKLTLPSGISLNIDFTQDVDLVVAGMTITKERLKMVDFSYFYWEEKLGMLTGTVSGDPFYMFQPLHTYVWLSFAAAALSAAVVVACCEISSVKLGKTTGFMQPLDSLWYTFGAMWLKGTFF